MTTTFDDAAATAPTSTRGAWWCACLLILVALIDSQVVAAIAPAVAGGLGATKAMVAASASVYAAAAAATALLLGRYGRNLRARRWLPLASLLFVGANLLAASAPHIALFWAARAVAGLAGGLISALAIAALADASSYARRGRQMSGVAISYFLAPVLGVPLGAWASGQFGWRAVFVATAALVGVAGLLVRAFPLPSAVLTDANSEAREPRQAAAAATTTASTASLWRLATRTRSTRRGIVSAFFVSGGLVGLTAYLGTWLSDAFGAGERTVGLVYAVAGAGAVAGGALGGVLADRYGKRRIAAWASIGFALFVFVLPGFAWSAKLWTLIALAAFLAALRIAPLQALITELVAPEERATYVALRNGASQLGIAAAVAVGARIYPAYGLGGIGTLCAALSLGAYLSLRKLEEPGAAATNEATAAAHVTPPGRGRRVVRGLLKTALVLVLIVAVGLPYMLSFLITKAGTRPGERDQRDTPAAQNVSYEDVTFNSVDGNQLSGWYLPAQGTNVTIILTHGLFRSRYEMLERGLALWREGYGVLLYDLRRHGRSGRTEFSSIGYDERHDVEAALKFVRERAPGGRVVLLGVSMGAAATLLAAAEDHGADILCVVADSSFLSFADTVRHHLTMPFSIPPPHGSLVIRLPAFPFATLLLKFTAWRLNFSPDAFDLAAAVRKIPPPILFIGSTQDVRMPPATVLEPLYAAATNPLKSKLIIEGASHGHAFDAAPAEYVTTVTDFVRRAEAASAAR